MWAGFSPTDTDDALGFQARNPAPPTPPRATFMEQAGEFAASPFKGLAQAANESLRIVNRVGSIRMQQDPPERRGMGGPIPMLFPNAQASIDAQRAAAEESRARLAEESDEFLKGAADYWRPDPVTATAASRLVQDASRLLGKVGAYSAAGGPVGAVFGVGVDEGFTGYLELRDKGVDPATAAKVGAVRGAATAAGVALPIAGRTVAQTATLVAAGGPGAFITEQAATRQILESANYPELAAEHDPFDPVGLGVSLLFTGTVGAVAHRARAKGRSSSEPANLNDGGNAPAEPTPAPRPADALADEPQVRDAAHVAYQQQVAEAHMLGDRADPQARASHAQAVEVAQRAMEAGEAVRLPALEVAPARAARLVEELGERLRAVETEMAAVRAAEPVWEPQPMPAAPEPAALPMPQPEAASIAQTLAGSSGNRTDGTSYEPVTRGEPASAMQRAEEAIRARPDLPVRMDEADEPIAARDLLEDVRHELALDKNDAKAFQAAINCFLRTGS